MVQMLQMLLNALGWALTLDGILGPATKKAVAELRKQKPSMNQVLDEMITRIERERREQRGASIEELNIIPSFVSDNTLRSIIPEIALRYDVPQSYLWLTLSVENPRSSGGFIIDAKPPFVGLGQFNRVTWEAVMAEPFESATDPKLAIEAICKLYVENKSYHERTSTLDFSDEVAYLYHNQGAPSARSFLVTKVLKYPHQSDKALELFKGIA